MTTISSRAAPVLNAWKEWGLRNFGCAGWPSLILAAGVTALVAGVNFADTYWPTTVGYLISYAVVFFALLGCGWLLGIILRRVIGYPLRWVYGLVVLGAATVELFRRGAGEGYSARVVAFSLGVAAMLALFGISLWNLAVRRKLLVTTCVVFLLSAAALAAIGVFLFSGGYENQYIEQYLALTPERETQEAFQASLDSGPYTVSVLDYGTEGGLDSDTVSLSPYCSRSDETFTGRYTDYYLDYSLSAVPLAGRIWYPEETENCPVLFFAHGNHEIAVDSYLGYAYLGEYLASHGYVVVSVDQNACNMLNGENDARAILLLRNIGQVLLYNEDSACVLFGKIDEDNIAIGGHSRGGEMAPAAYLFNGYDRYPENGNITFDYHYSIRSIVAIAPTVNQYQPADHSVKLQNVNYLLLHGTDDRDVKNFMGMAQYENITFSGDGDYIKSALYIAGANHGQFNSLWGAYDQSAPFGWLLNTNSLISQEAQQQIACLFIKTFLDVTLRGDRSCGSLLTDWNAYAGQLPDTVYAQCYETSHTDMLADFEEDSDLETGSVEGSFITTESLSKWTEELIDFADESSYETHALRIRTGYMDSSWALTIPETDARNCAVRLDVSQWDDNDLENETYQLADFLVILTDSGGNTASARVGDFANLYPAFPVQTDKLDYLFQNYTMKHGFTTVTIPLSEMEAAEGFNPAEIIEIRLSFDTSMELLIDNIGLETVPPAENAGDTYITK